MCLRRVLCLVSRRVGIVTFRTPRGSLEGIQKGGEKTRKMSNFFLFVLCLYLSFLYFIPAET